MSRSKESWNEIALPIVRLSTGVHGSADVRCSAPYSTGSGRAAT
jgi:hypothetical protein